MQWVWRSAFVGGLMLLATGVQAAPLALRGIGGELEANVRDHLRLDDAPCDAPEWRLRRLRRQAEKEIRTALEAYGYYEPVVSISPLERDDDCWKGTVEIRPGEPVRLRRVEVTLAGEAAADEDFRRIAADPPLREGEVLDHGRYERYKRAITDLARRRGYFAAAFSASRLDVYPAERAADVTLAFESGPRYRFGEVRFEQDVVSPGLVARFVRFRPGEPWEGERIEELYDALLATGWFASVDIRTAPEEAADLSVPVTVTLTTAKRQVYLLGAGYSTDAGPKLRAGYTNRRLNDRGHQLDATLSLSSVLSEAGVSYRLPRNDPRIEWFSVDGGYQHEETDTSTSDIWKIGVKEFRRRSGGWIETRFVDLGVERFEVAGDRQREFLLIPGLSWSRTVPSGVPVSRLERGYRLTGRVSGSTAVLGSDSDFLQVDLYGKGILPLWPGARLLVRGEAGATLKDRFLSLPASVRYFAGGDNSVRGYDYESLGPTNEEGEVVGGSHRFTASAEVDQRVFGNWSVAAFVDTGNAIDSFSSITTKTGAGGGLRWYSPLGPVRLDIAFPLDKDAPDDWRIHVTLGPDL